MTPVDDRLSSSSAVVRSGIFNLAGFGASALYMILLVPIVLHYLGREHYGLWTAVLAITGYIGLADLGVSSSFVTYIARTVAAHEYRQSGRVVHLGLLFYLLVTLIMLGLSSVAGDFFFTMLRIPAETLPLAQQTLTLAVAVFGVTSVAGVYGSVLGAIQRVDLFNMLAIASYAARLVVITLALSLGFGVPGLLAGDALVTVLNVPVLLILIRRELPEMPLGWLSYDHDLMKRMLRFGIQMQVSRIADVVQTQWDKLVLTRALGLSAATMYDVGARPSARLRMLPITAIASLVPAVSALDARDQQERIRAALVRATRYLALISAPMFGLAVVFADPILRLWLNDAGYTQAAWTLRILSAALFVNVVAGALSLVAQGRGEPQYQMRTTLIQAVLNLILSVVLVLQFGFYGAACGTGISIVFGGLLFFHVYGKRIMPAPLKTLFTLAAKPVLCVVPAGVAGYLASLAGRMVPSESLRIVAALELIPGVLVFAAVYIAMVRVTRVLTADDMGFFRNALPMKVQRLLRLTVTTEGKDT
ncbi:MAG TPA: polysaccharide biosynthesis C-terminal domain-containing protein [Bacteroidota bacterium]|nr:polysaccharide biosynthesis C-terminal domain-containing protein [Bacteroidota bacterium]